MLTDLKKYALLLSILLLLVALKFLIIPIVEWQNSAFTNIVLLEKKQNKIQTVISNVEATQFKISELAKVVDTYQGMFFVYEQESSFKIQQQKYIEKLLSTHELRASNLGWQSLINNQEQGLKIFPLNINISGNSLNLIKFMTAIESNSHRIAIDDFNISLSKQKEFDLGIMNGKLVLLFIMLDTTNESNKVAE